MNCKPHYFALELSSIRTIGEVELERCNVCLAVRVTFRWVVKVGDKWVDKRKRTTIRDPRG